MRVNSGTIKSNRQYMRRIGIALALLIPVLLAACGSDDGTAAPSPTQVAIVRQLATARPTDTPDPNNPVLQATPTPSITPQPSPTIYIGAFLGEAPLTGGGFRPGSPAISQPVETPGVVAICQFEADPVFGTAWRGESRVTNGLRCAIQEMFGFDARVQVFQRGVMYLRPDTNEVWAIAPGGTVLAGRQWTVGQPSPVTPLTIDAPQGMQVPQGTLGAVWSAMPEVREALGFAVLAESNTEINFQRFDGGALLLDLDTGQTFALLVTGAAYGPY
jgi:hypothetical protein